jgi:hypothetical protein
MEDRSCSKCGSPCTVEYNCNYCNSLKWPWRYVGRRWVVSRKFMHLSKFLPDPNDTTKPFPDKYAIAQLMRDHQNAS